jgi:hypothetical protein
MAVLGRLLVTSAERLDLPDFLSIDSYVQGDFKYLLKSFVGDSKPYVLKGFDVINPGNAIGGANISITVADSVVYFPGSTAGPYFYGLPAGNALSAPLVPNLRKNTTNYVYLTLSTADTAADTRALWDPDVNSGAGGEFTQNVNTETVLTAVINVSVSSFPVNTIPICKVIVGANFITSIQDCRDMMFRLGSGGLNPDPLNKYAWSNNPLNYSRTEPNTTMTGALNPNPFQGGDKNIQSLKEWMDAVMTKLGELGGTTYWYENTTALNLINIFQDTLGTSIRSKGSWTSDSITPGMLTWSEDILIQSTTDFRDIIVRANSETLANNQVMYIDKIRNAAINTGGIDVNWINGANYINGTLGTFENVSKGDWIKKSNDIGSLYLRVEELYAGSALAGGVTSSPNALSVKLSSTYQGLTEPRTGVYTKGVYLSSDISVADRNSTAINALGGDFCWLAMRSDTIMSVSNITTTQLTCDVTLSNGVTATLTSVAHGLTDKQRVTISNSTNFNGTYSVMVEDVNTFVINLPSGPFADETSVYACFATVYTQVSNTPNNLQLESATHSFQTDQIITIANTVNYNATTKVFVLGSSSFTIPVDSLIAPEISGTATAANIYVKTEVGPSRLDMGATQSVGTVSSTNVMSFIGMDNNVELHPLYNTPSNYGTLNSQENYYSNFADNLSTRVSQLTSMMADKAQDKTVKYVYEFNLITNVTSGAAQLLTFSASTGTPTVKFIMPGSVNFSNTITLTGTLSLNVNQAAYFVIDRNAGFSIASLNALTVVDINDVPVTENVFIFAFRLSDTTVQLYDGTYVELGMTSTHAGEIIKATLRDNFHVITPVGAPCVIDGITVTNHMSVLFTNLTTNNNSIYTAHMSGINVDSWYLESPFSDSANPTDGDYVTFQQGTSYGGSLARYSTPNAQWEIDLIKRHFNGNDYFEQSALYTTDTLNNVVTPTALTTYPWAGSEFSIIEYSIVRGTARETGTIKLVTDGITVALSNDAANLSSTGITISADISGADLRVLYVSDNSGSAGTLKFSMKRWSNSFGGPAGLPTYTIAGSGILGGGVTVSGSPLNGEIAIFTGSADITGNTNFKIDTSDGSLNLNGLRINQLSSPITLLDNTITPVVVLFLDTTLYPFSIIEYSIVRNGDRRVGRLMLTHNGIIANVSDDFSSTADLGTTFTADITGSDVRLKYATTATSFNGTMKYSIRKWA